jgi:hypothetical protein
MAALVVRIHCLSVGNCSTRQRFVPRPNNAVHLKAFLPWFGHHNLNVDALCFGLFLKASAIGAIRSDFRQTWTMLYQPRHEPTGNDPIQIVGFGHEGFQDQSFCIHYQLTLPTRYGLPGIVAARPPFALVFTDWLSAIPALGVAARPNA